MTSISSILFGCSWEEAQIILRRAGYENPEEQYVCFSQKKAKGGKAGGKKHLYNGKWNIMDEKKKQQLANMVEERTESSTII